MRPQPCHHAPGVTAMQTLFDFAAKRAELQPDALAFAEVETGRRTSFAEFNAAAERGASVLAGLGVAAGDRVAVLSHNSVTFFELLFACGKLGSILVPLNWRQTAAELAPILADCGARALFHDAATAPLAQRLGSGAGLNPIGFIEYAARARSEPPTRRPSAWRSDR